jgi:DNA-binding LacI/PurR family transcriptional regulator
VSRVTIRDVAKHANISIATVSLALNGKQVVNAETRKRVLESAAELGYKPNAFGKGLKTRTSRTLALIIPNITDPSMHTLIKGIETASDFNEYSLIIHDLEIRANKKLKGVEILYEKALDGIIYAYPDGQDKGILDSIIDRGDIPLVVIGNVFQNMSINRIEVDSFNSGEIMAEYLYELGHKDILVLSGNMTTSRKLRIDGMNSVLGKYGLVSKVFTKENLQSTRSLFFDTRGYDNGFSMMIDVLNEKTRYSAVVGMTDMISAGAMNALKMKGISIPKEISIASFGGYFISEISEPSITVVEYPHYEIGKASFEILKKIINNKRDEDCETVSLVFKPKLVVRKSTARCLK